MGCGLGAEEAESVRSCEEGVRAPDCFLVDAGAQESLQLVQVELAEHIHVDRQVLGPGASGPPRLVKAEELCAAVG
ncbi:hypothetical protein GCM10018966_067350 [Streptomyces yanii]